MATYTPFQPYQPPRQFTEPCMNCFASVTYDVDEPTDSKSTVGMKSIICPFCGEEMYVNFRNTSLC